MRGLSFLLSAVLLANPAFGTPPFVVHPRAPAMTYIMQEALAGRARETPHFFTRTISAEQNRIFRFSPSYQGMALIIFPAAISKVGITLLLTAVALVSTGVYFFFKYVIPAWHEFQVSRQAYRSEKSLRKQKQLRPGFSRNRRFFIMWSAVTGGLTGLAVLAAWLVDTNLPQKESDDGVARRAGPGPSPRRIRGRAATADEIQKLKAVATSFLTDAASLHMPPSVAFTTQEFESTVKRFTEILDADGLTILPENLQDPVRISIDPEGGSIDIDEGTLAAIFKEDSAALFHELIHLMPSQIASVTQNNKAIATLTNGMTPYIVRESAPSLRSAFLAGQWNAPDFARLTRLHEPARLLLQNHWRAELQAVMAQCSLVDLTARREGGLAAWINHRTDTLASAAHETKEAFAQRLDNEPAKTIEEELIAQIRVFGRYYDPARVTPEMEKRLLMYIVINSRYLSRLLYSLMLADPTAPHIGRSFKEQDFEAIYPWAKRTILLPNHSAVLIPAAPNPNRDSNRHPGEQFARSAA